MTSSLFCRHRRCIICSVLVCWLLGSATGAWGALRPPKDVPEYRLRVTVNPAAGTIQGQAMISDPAGRPLRVDPGELDLHQIKHRGQILSIKRRAAGLLLLPSPVEITFTVDLSKTEDNYFRPGEVLLLGLWYPVVEGFCRFQVTAVVPAGYLAVSEAEEIDHRDRGDRQEFFFAFPHPVHDEDGVTLAVSNRWVVAAAQYNGIDLKTYFYPEQAHLAPHYLERTKKTLARYQKLLSPFPYRRLALVANSQEVTQAFPTYILMDQEEFNIKDLDRSPLDHEILHQWLGCGISADLARGNWFEGLTIYLADHLLMEEKGQGWQCRRRILSGFQAYMQRQREFPLRDFTERLDKHSRVIGYGKGALVFHMLRRQIGDGAFFTGLRQFVRQNLHTCASWNDLARAFQQASGQNLTWFFRQWVEGTGQPELRAANVRVKPVGPNYEVNLRLNQPGPVKRLRVPITFYGLEKSRTMTLTLQEKTRQATFVLDFLPQEVVIDEHYDVFRRLSAKENPPTVERLAASHLAIVPAAGLEDRARRLLEVWRQKEVSGQVWPAAKAASPTWPASSFLILGAAHPWVPQLFGTLDLPPQGWTILVRPHPQQPGALVGLVHGPPGEDVDTASRKLLTYPFASEVHLENGQIAWSRLAPTEQGIRQALPAPITPTQ